MPSRALTTTCTIPGPPGQRRITVDEYERIIQAAALDDPDRVELVDRQIEVYTEPGPGGYGSRV